MLPADEKDDECLDDPIRLFDYEQDRVLKYSEITSVTIEDPGYAVDLNIEDHVPQPEKEQVVHVEKSLVSHITERDYNLLRESPLDIKVTDTEKLLNDTNKNSTISYGVTKVNQTCPMAVPKCDKTKTKNIHLLFQNDNKLVKERDLEMAKSSSHIEKEKTIQPKSKKMNFKRNKAVLIKGVQKDSIVNEVPVGKGNPISKNILNKSQDCKVTKEVSEVDVYERIIAKAYQKLKALVKPSDVNNKNYKSKVIDLSNDFQTNMSHNNCKSYETCNKCLEIGPTYKTFTDNKRPKKVCRSKSLYIPPVQKEIQVKKGFVTPTITSANSLKAYDDCKFGETCNKSLEISSKCKMDNKGPKKVCRSNSLYIPTVQKEIQPQKDLLSHIVTPTITSADNLRAYDDCKFGETCNKSLDISPKCKMDNKIAKKVCRSKSLYIPPVQKEIQPQKEVLSHIVTPTITSANNLRAYDDCKFGETCNKSLEISPMFKMDNKISKKICRSKSLYIPPVQKEIQPQKEVLSHIVTPTITSANNLKAYDDSKFGETCKKSLEIRPKCKMDNRIPKKVCRSKSLYIPPVQKEIRPQKDLLSHIVIPTITNANNFKAYDDCYLRNYKNLKVIAQNDNSHMYTADKARHTMTGQIRAAVHNQNIIVPKMAIPCNRKTNLKRQEVDRNIDQITMPNLSVPSFVTAYASEKPHSTISSGCNERQCTKSCVSYRNSIMEYNIIPHYHEYLLSNKTEILRQRKSNEVSSKTPLVEFISNELPIDLSLKKIPVQIDINKNKNNGVKNNSFTNLSNTASLSQANLFSTPVRTNSIVNTVTATKNKKAVKCTMTPIITQNPFPKHNSRINESNFQSNKGIHIPIRCNSKQVVERDKCNAMAHEYIPVLLDKTTHPISQVNQNNYNLSSIFPIQSIISNRPPQADINYNLQYGIPRQPLLPTPLLPSSMSQCYAPNFYNNIPDNNFYSSVNYTPNVHYDINRSNFAGCSYGSRTLIQPQVHSNLQTPSVVQSPNISTKFTNTNISNILHTQEIVKINNKKEANTDENVTTNKSPNTKETAHISKNSNNNHETSIKHINPCEKSQELVTEKQSISTVSHTKQPVNIADKNHANMVENKNLKSNTCTGIGEIVTNNSETKLSDNNQKNKYITITSTHMKAQKFAVHKQTNDHNTKTNVSIPGSDQFVNKHPELVEVLKRPLVTNTTLVHNVPKTSSGHQNSIESKTDINVTAPKKEYSPPILPILSYENILEILQSKEFVNCYQQQRHPFLTAGPINEATKINRSDFGNMNNKRKLNDDDDKDKKAKKISLSEYKKRSVKNAVGSIENITPTDNKNATKKPSYKYHKAISVEDLNYDSDATVKL